jgi:hypothetical protein
VRLWAKGFGNEGHENKGMLRSPSAWTSEFRGDDDRHALVRYLSGHGQKAVVVLSGAGVSAESGLYAPSAIAMGFGRQYRIEDVATPEAFARDPALVFHFYDQRRAQVLAAAAESSPPQPSLSLEKVISMYT